MGAIKLAVNCYQDLRAWQFAFALAKLAYDLADRLPDYERFALSSQIRRAATSIFGNIAEGYGSGTRPKFLNHLRIARGSARELDSYIRFVRDRQPSLIPPNLESSMDETCRVLQGFDRNSRKFARSAYSYRREPGDYSCLLTPDS